MSSMLRPAGEAATERFDIAVVGAGIVGAAAAYRLARAGSRVAVFDAGAAAAGTTANSFSWLNAVAKQPEAYHRLNAAGMAEYQRLARELPAITVHGGGAVQWVSADADGRWLEQQVARLQGWGYAARLIDRAALAALEPAVRPEPAVERFAYYERDGWVDAPAVARTLLAGVEATGGRLYPHRAVTGFRSDDERITDVLTDAGWVETGAVLLCAGVDTADLAHLLDTPIAVERHPGLLAVTTPVPAGTLARVMYAPGVHLRPDVSGGIRIGADDIDALTSEETAADPPPPWVSELLARAMVVLPSLQGASIARVHVGIRPVPEDGQTIAGRLPGWDNAYMVVTHSGVTLGPLLGRLLAEEITGGTSDPLLAPFRPERFAPLD